MKRFLKAGAMCCMFALLQGAPVLAETARWYSDGQVEQGAQLFRANCAECHGQNAESKPGWKQPDANGNFPPPPLNGTAHAWHHPLDILRRQIREGGIPLGGQMPPFKEKLSPDEIDAVVAFFQSKWSDAIYAKWDARNKPPSRKNSLMPIVMQDVESQAPKMTALLRKLVRAKSIGEPEETRLDNIYLVKIGGNYVYLTGDGRYLLTGDVIDLKTRENLADSAKARDARKLIAAFPEKDMIVYRTETEEKGHLTILTDTTCPFCRKLHGEIGEILNAGFSVRYIAFPRDGLRGVAYTQMRSVWCAEDRPEAMNIAKGTSIGDLPDGSCDAADAVDRGYELGRKMGISGTPSLILQSGQRMDGYAPADQLIRLLKEGGS